MGEAMLKHMTGEELLYLRIFGGEGVAGAIETELDRRARSGLPARPILVRRATERIVHRPAAAA